MADTLIYSITGPHVTRGTSQWFLWERVNGGIPQCLDVLTSETQALEAKRLAEQEMVKS